MMPTFPRSPLRFRTVSFPQYGSKAGMSDRAFPDSASVKLAPSIPVAGHQAIDIADGNPLGRPTPQHIELMPKGENFGLQGCARPQQPGHGVADQLEEIAHRRDFDRFAGDRQPFWVCVKDTPATLLSILPR